MEKIDFVNNDIPALNARNLNKLQDNIEDALEEQAFDDVTVEHLSVEDLEANTITSKRGNLVVDSIRSKNMFNNGVERKDAYPVVNIGQTISYNSSSASYTYVKCCYLEAGKTYTFSWKKNTPASTNSRDSVIVDSNNIELENKSLWRNDYESTTWTPSYSGYLVLCMDKNTTDFQIEEGDTATPYSPYQNLDGQETYSTDEQKIGTWLGKPLYRKVFINNGYSATIIIPAPYAQTLTKIEALIQRSDYSSIFLAIPSRATDNNYKSDFGNISLINNNIEVALQIGTNLQSIIGKIIVIVEYTKVTDTPSLLMATPLSVEENE